MTALLIDPTCDRNQLLESLYRGDLVVLSTLRAVSEYVEFARQRLAELFAPHHPEAAHRHIEPREMAALLGKWKPWFIHHERSKELVRSIIREAGFAPADTHFDVPKPRTSFPVDHLTTGIAFAFPWHRDTWYAAPRQQINWWMPIHPVRVDNAMKFDLESFGKSVPNDSEDFDYYDLNRARLTTATQVKKETQVRPGAVGHAAHDELVVLLPPGSILLFSGAHLHASVPNTSGLARYSVDFRTVDRRHVADDVGAPLQDARCTGIALRDFVNAETGARFDEQLVRRLHGAPPADAVLVFDEKVAAQSRTGRDGPRRPSSGAMQRVTPPTP
jgi:hypothetical protein